MGSEDYFKLVQFYQNYAAAIDQQDWDTWLAFFTENGVYKIQSRENFERGLPMAALSLAGKGMLKDRIYGVTETIFHEPYWQLHIVSQPRIITQVGDVIDSQANYSVFRTKMDGIAHVFNVGRYIDRLKLVDGEFKIESRLCVFDNDMILNSLIYPI
jgi:salicylate 5-hydroxylase small subunit